MPGLEPQADNPQEAVSDAAKKVRSALDAHRHCLRIDWHVIERAYLCHVCMLIADGGNLNQIQAFAGTCLSLVMLPPVSLWIHAVGKLVALAGTLPTEA